MERSEKIFFSVLEYVSKASKAETCAEFVKEVLDKDEECRKAVLNPNDESSARINQADYLKQSI